MTLFISGSTQEYLDPELREVDVWMLSAGNQDSRDPPQRGRLDDIPGMVKVDVSIAGMSCLEGSIPYL